MSRSPKPQPCRGPSRREVLRVGMLSAFGLGVADLLRLQAQAADLYHKQAPAVGARAKSCILIWQAGGPSHIDTFDPKPEAGSDVRGEFKPIDTAVPGVKITEIYPRLAKVMDKVTLIRSVTSPEAEHDRGAHHMLTGYRPSPALVYPSYGSVVAKVREDLMSPMPPYVAVPDAPIFSSSGYLTPAYDPFSVNGDPNIGTFRVRDLSPPDQLTLDRLRRRRSMVQKLDQFSQDVGQTPLTTSRDQFTARAYDLLTSKQAQAAFKISDETPATRDRYGRNTLGQSCLLARRLVEAGVPFITLNDRGAQQLGWDTHQQNFTRLKNSLAPQIDQGVSTLLADLAERGLLDSTLVIMMGEFGRTPKINQNAGRDHHSRANSVLMAGASLPPGTVIGRTDGRGDMPADRPVTPADLAATLYTLLGIDPAQRFETPDGQPIRLVDKGEPLSELV